MQPIAYPKQIEVVVMILDGITPKEISYRLGLSLDTVYKIRAKYCVETWILKKDPSPVFKLKN